VAGARLVRRGRRIELNARNVDRDPLDEARIGLSGRRVDDDIAVDEP
jgi:hypothetical protein